MISEGGLQDIVWKVFLRPTNGAIRVGCSTNQTFISSPKPLLCPTPPLVSLPPPALVTDTFISPDWLHIIPWQNTTPHKSWEHPFLSMIYSALISTATKTREILSSNDKAFWHYTVIRADKLAKYRTQKVEDAFWDKTSIQLLFTSHFKSFGLRPCMCEWFGVIALTECRWHKARCWGPSNFYIQGVF